MTGRRLRLICALALLGLLGGTLYLAKLVLENQEELQEANHRRHDSFRLADELRQTSDDLTRMARTYVVTGDPRYEEYFRHIIAIRDGAAPRPRDYGDIYWDYVTASGENPRPDIEAVALETLMSEMDFTEEEFQLLRRAKSNSDALIALEERAMNAVKGFFPDSDGAYTIKGDPDIELAAKLLHGDAYHLAKAAIMEPIEAFFAEVDSRTAGEIDRLNGEGRSLLLVAAILVALSILLAVALYLGIRGDLGTAERAAPTHLQVEGRPDSYWPIWAAALAAIGLVVGFTWWNQSRIEAQTIRDLGDTLTTVLDTTGGAVGHWIREREGEIQIWAEHSDIRQLAGDLVEAGANPEMLPEQPAQTLLREQMSGLLHEGRVEGFLVVTLEGLVVAADVDSDLGKEALQLMPPALLSQVLDGPRHTTLGLPHWSGSADQRGGGHRASMYVATLLQDEEGADLGVLVFRIDPEKDFTEILQRGRLGVSGESYAFNSAGQLISESRFEEDLRRIGLIPPGERGILNVDIRNPGGDLVQGHSPKTAREDQPLTLMARTAISGQPGFNLAGYNDYRGVEVIGAWTWDQEHALGITTELDFAEAYGSLRRARWLTVIGTGLTVLLIVVLTGIFVRSRRLIGDSLASLQRANVELQSMNSAILRWAPDGTVVHLNKFGQDLFGFTEKELVGKPLLGTLVPETESTGRSLRQMIEGICSDPSEYEINENENSCKDGRRIWMAWRNKPILNRDKSLREILTVGIDITERKEAEQKLEAISDSAADAIVIADSSHTVVGWNKAAETILGWPSDEMLGRPLQTFIPERYRAAHQAGMDRVTQTGEGRILGRPMELSALHREGREVSIELSLSTWTVASERFYTGILRDITERKKMVTELHEARKDAEAANQAKSAFLANMSHELRTPLNGVLGYSQLLKRDTGLAPEQRVRLDAIESCGNHLLDLINDVLDLSKIEAGRMDIDLGPTDFGKLVKGVADIIRPRAETEGLEFRVEIAHDVPSGIRTDGPKLRQVLVNLLGNAVKFTREGWVGLSVALSSPGRLQIDVEDTGAGIASEKLAEIFDPFKQAEAGKESGGTGLGLAISRRMVELLDGELTVESELGQGSRFIFSLPFEEVTEEDLGAIVGDTFEEDRDYRLVSGQDVAVLVADDNEVNREILVGLLTHAGFRTGEASNGEEALARLREESYGLVLMDMIMPVLDGMGATRAMRADPKLRDTVVFAVTASVLEDDRKKVMDSGCDDFIPKPFRASELFTKIERHLGVRYEDAASPVADDGVEDEAEVPLGSDEAREVAAALRAAGDEGDFEAATEVGEKLRSTGKPSWGRRIIKHAQDFDFAALEELASELEADAAE